MPSLIDITKPATGQATTQSVRDNFLVIKNEIEALQTNISSAGLSIKVPFSFGQVSPSIVYTNNTIRTVVSASIVIETPFNGAGASLVLGDVVVSDKFIKSIENDPTFITEWQTSPNAVTNSDILLTINAGSAASAGSGFIILDII